MKQKIWKIFLLLPPLAALILEILPYGAVLIFGEPAMLLILLLFIPALLGVWGTWISVPLSQAVISIVSAVFLFIFRTKKSGSTESKQNV